MANESFHDDDDLSFPRAGTDGASGLSGLLRRRFYEAKDAYIESAMGKEESWAKKVGGGISGVKLVDIPKLLQALGLKIVDRKQKCVDEDEYRAYKTLARKYVEATTKADWMPKGDE